MSKKNCKTSKKKISNKSKTYKKIIKSIKKYKKGGKGFSFKSLFSRNKTSDAVKQSKNTSVDTYENIYANKVCDDKRNYYKYNIGLLVNPQNIEETCNYYDKYENDRELCKLNQLNPQSYPVIRKCIETKPLRDAKKLEAKIASEKIEQKRKEDQERQRREKEEFEKKWYEDSQATLRGIHARSRRGQY